MTLFVFGMLAASGLGFLKLIALAHVMAAPDYGQYVSLFGVGSLAGALFSMGVTERSIKAYPRWWVEGRLDAIRSDAAAAARTMGLRFTTLALVGGLVFGFLDLSLTAIHLLGFVGVGWVTAWLAQAASVYRAAGAQTPLLRFAVARGVLVAVFAVVGGLYGGWGGALLGDTLAGVVVLGGAVWDLGRVLKTNPSMAPGDVVVPTPEAAGGHRQLYLANLLSSSTVMLDRAWVGAAMGSTGAGRYGVVMLLPQVAQLLVNVVVQHIGPLIIKRVHLGHLTQGRLGALNLQSGLMALFALALVVAACVAKRVPYLDAFFLKYGVSDWALLWAGVLAAGQVFAVIEFQLIAHDRETDILWASASSAVLFVLLFAGVACVGGGVEAFVAAAALSRWWQVVWLRRAYGRLGV